MGLQILATPRQHPWMSRDIQKRQMNFFKVFPATRSFCYWCIWMKGRWASHYKWLQLQSNFKLSEDWPYQLDMSCTSSIRARNQKYNNFSKGIGHWACPFIGVLFLFPLRLSQIADAISTTHRWHLMVSLSATLHTTALQRCQKQNKNQSGPCLTHLKTQQLQNSHSGRIWNF